MSENSQSGFPKILWKNILEKFDHIFPQNKETFLYFKKLGLKIKFLGNLKFIGSNNDKLNRINRKYFQNKIILCSASTIIMRKKFLQIYIKFKKKIPNLLTIIIPT